MLREVFSQLIVISVNGHMYIVHHTWKNSASSQLVAPSGAKKKRRKMPNQPKIKGKIRLNFLVAVVIEFFLFRYDIHTDGRIKLQRSLRA